MFAPLKDALNGPHQATEGQTKQVLQLRRIHHRHDVHVIVQIVAHAGQVVQGGNAVLQQVRVGANT